MQQQQQQQKPLSVNCYIPKKKEKKKYEWYEHDLMTYINDLKYEHFVEDMDSRFTRAKITNIDLIHHQCHGDKLQNSQCCYETIFNKDFKYYKDSACNQAISFEVRSDRDDIHFECNILKKYMRSDVKKALMSNGILLGKVRKNVRPTTAKV